MSDQKANPETSVWAVYVDDNFHFMDESERYLFGKFDRYEDAVAACKEVLDREFDHYVNSRACKTAADVLDMWRKFGDNPFIIGPPVSTPFRARDYLETRCEQSLGSRPSEDP